MNQQTDEQRTADDKIARLRKRVKGLHHSDAAVAAILLGILDLLDDEL